MNAAIGTTKSGIGALVLAMMLAGAATARAQRPAAFWADLGDTTLTRLIDRALVANHDVRVAQARLRAARAARTAAALELAPVVTASGAYARQRLSNVAVPGAAGTLPAQDAWDAGVLLSWEVDVFGRSRRALQGQQAYAASAQEGLREIQLLVAAELGTAYFDLLGARDRLATSQRNAENQRSTLALTLERLEAGRGNAFDSERARAQLSSTLADIPLIETSMSAIEHRIGVLVGDPSAEAPRLPGGEPLFPALPAILLANADSLIRGRPDVRGAERRFAARSALSGAASAGYLPRLTLAGSAGYSSGSAATFGDRGTARYAIGPVLSWPLLDIGRVKAGVDVARAEESDARARYEQTVLGARQELAISLVTYQKSRERLEHLQDAAVASERAAELARIRFREGATDFLQVLDSERTLLAAQDRRSQGRTDATRALMAVYRAMGGGALP